MALVLAQPSTAIEMIGPYLAAMVICPACKVENVFARAEGPVSPVKPVSVCSHIRAHFVDDDGESQFEFEV